MEDPGWSEADVLNPLEQAIEEFHKLRDDSRRLMEQARWPEAKDPSREQSPAEQAPVPPGHE